MSETQAKARKLDLKISRKTINAIHKSDTSIKDMSIFNQNQVQESAQDKKALNLKVTRKNSELNRNIVANKAKRTIKLPKMNEESTTAISKQAEELINKLDNIDNESFEPINELPLEYASDFNKIDTSINNAKSSQEKRTIHNARRGKVKNSDKTVSVETAGDKPYYMVVDTEINYNEIASRPSKKASELIDQNSNFFTSPSIFESSDIACLKVDLSNNYGSDYLISNNESTADAINVEFIGGQTDEDYFKNIESEKSTKASTIKNNFIVKSDDIPQNGKSDANSNYVVINKVDTNEFTTEKSLGTKMLSDELISEILSTNESGEEYAASTPTHTAESVVAFPVENVKKPFKSNFTSSIFKKFTYEEAVGEIEYENIAKLPNTSINNQLPNIDYLELAENGSMPTDAIESARNVFESIAPVQVDTDFIQEDEDFSDLNLSNINTKTTILENDYYTDIKSLDEGEDDSSDDAYLAPEEDDSAIEFDDAENDNLLEAEIVDTDDDIDINDISLEDIDLSDIDLNDDNIFNKLTIPETKEKEADKSENDISDELLSEVLLESELPDFDVDVEDEDEDEEKTNQSSFEEEKNADSDFYKLIDSLSNTITDLENSIAIEDDTKEEPVQKPKNDSGKAFSILINKDDIFSISIENESYEIVADFAGISVKSENINISTPKNNFFVKVGNKYIEIHRKEDSKFVVYTNFEDIEFENAINNITFAKKKNRIELSLRESFKLASVSNKISLSVLNTNLASKMIEDTPIDVNNIENNQNSVCDNKVLTINEETQKVYLPYEIEDVMNFIKNPNNDYHTIRDVVDGEYTLSLSLFKNPVVARFREAYNFMRVKEKSSVYAALDLALELMFNSNLNPAIIRACKDLRELNVYLDCLYENELEKFDCFKIVYKVLPRVQ